VRSVFDNVRTRSDTKHHVVDEAALMRVQPYMLYYARVQQSPVAINHDAANDDES
jgi:hypothetical protein